MPAGEQPSVVLRNAVKAAQEGAQRTSSMRAGAGRAAYVPAKGLEGVADPGALAVGTWLSAIEAALLDSPL